MKLLFVIITVIVLIVSVPCFAGVKNEVKKGNLLYNKGKFQDALKRYENALEKAPESDVVNFNLGTALYKNQEFDKAIGNFEKSLLTKDVALEQKASYNLGNAKYKSAISKEKLNLEQAVSLLKQSIRHYERAMQLDAKDTDAKHNYEFVKKELERFEKQLKQKQQQDSEKDKENNEKQDQENQQQQNQKNKSEEQKISQDNQAREDQDRSQQEQAQQQNLKEKSGNQAESNKEKQEQMEEQRSRAEGEDNKNVSQSQEKPLQSGEMSEKEVKMLLETYRDQEEPKGLLKENPPVRNLPEDYKDW